ncbi:hypothetical protein ACFE04_007300 [Oxalis oulophora]
MALLFFSWVKVLVREKGSSSLITLKAGKGQCSLDFKDLYMPVLVKMSGGMCIRFICNKAYKYERLDMELPLFNRWGSAATIIDEGRNVIKESECPYCRRLFCAQCKVPWHAGVQC